MEMIICETKDNLNHYPWITLSIKYPPTPRDISPNYCIFFSTIITSPDVYRGLLSLPFGLWGIASLMLSVCLSTLLANALFHQCIGGEKGYVTQLFPLVWPRSLSKENDIDKLCLVKMGFFLESICMEGQGHIFTFDLIFQGQHATPRGIAFSERFFILNYTIS